MQFCVVKYHKSIILVGVFHVFCDQNWCTFQKKGKQVLQGTIKNIVTRN
jgi:hypothetical protein